MAVIGFRAAGVSEPVRLDAAQRAVLALGEQESAVVLGAPGSGKTTALVELLAHRVQTLGVRPEQTLALTLSRATAARLRDRIGLRLATTTRGPLARSVSSLAFDIVTASFRAAGAEPPTLLTGGEQDGDIAALLAGQAEDGAGPCWPEPLGPQVRSLRMFRTELRELMMRCVELSVSPSRLRVLGEAHGHPEWGAAADFIDDYFAVVASSRPNQLDSAELVQFALAALGRDEAGETVAGLRLVVVDDVQQATGAAIDLLAGLARRGVAVVAFGDPDIAANAFRGGDPDVVGTLAARLGLPGMRTLLLDTVHRHGAAVRGMARAVTDRIGTAGAVGHRRAAGAGPDGTLSRIQAATAARMWSAVARLLRERHLLQGVGWDNLAVIVRSQGQLAQAQRILAAAEVPVRTTLAGTALRDEPGAACLLRLVAVALGHRPLDAPTATELLLGPVGGLDRLTLRRLKLALRAEELAGGGSRSGDDLLVDALAAPGRMATIDARVARQADRVARLLAEVSDQAARGASIEELLWLVWEGSALAEEWLARSRGSGLDAQDAGHSLDAVVALFTAAKRFVEREPAARPGVFLARTLDTEVPEDTLSPQGAAGTVLITTAAAAVGLEFDTVVVAGVQDGVWPNLKARGSLLHAHELVELCTGAEAPGGVIDVRRETLNDELRMFALALTRARRHVAVAAVANEDDSPSVFFSLLPPDAVAVDAARHPLTLRGLTGRLRRELTAPGRGEAARSEAARALAALAAEEVPGAHPEHWHGLMPASSTEKLYADEEDVPLSPSKLQAFEESPMDWAVQRLAGGASSTAMAVGTILHWAMETAPGPDVEALWQAILSRWGELEFECGWLSSREKALARRMAVGVAEYLADFAAAGKTLVAAERAFTMKLGRAAVSGAIDRVELAPDGGVVIVDLKTGKPLTNPAEINAHPQLGVYQLAYREHRLDAALAEHGPHVPGGAKLLYVREGVRGKAYREAIQARLDDDGLAALRERIELAAQEMAQPAFSGSPEPCGFGPQVAAARLQRVRAVSSD